jgi:hypothetical protein
LSLGYVRRSAARAGSRYVIQLAKAEGLVVIADASEKDEQLVKSLGADMVDRPSIGLLLCKERDHLTVEYALRDLKKPIGVAQWQTKLVESLPRNLKGSLPTVAEIEAELDNARPK